MFDKKLATVIYTKCLAMLTLDEIASNNDAARGMLEIYEEELHAMGLTLEDALHLVVRLAESETGNETNERTKAKMTIVLTKEDGDVHRFSVGKITTTVKHAVGEFQPRHVQTVWEVEPVGFEFVVPADKGSSPEEVISQLLDAQVKACEITIENLTSRERTQEKAIETQTKANDNASAASTPQAYKPIIEDEF